MASTFCARLFKFHQILTFSGNFAWSRTTKFNRFCFIGRCEQKSLFSSIIVEELGSKNSFENSEETCCDKDVESARTEHAFHPFETTGSEIDVQNQRLLKVAMIGEPNSGKSTLVNSLVGEKVSAVTNKPHTTRQGSQALFTQGDAQIVLLDTPGVVTQSEGRRLKMTREHVTAPENALQRADVICVVTDSADKRTRNRIHGQVIAALQRHKDIPSLLILNKIDRLKHKTDLLGLTAVLTEDREKDVWGYVDKGGWGNFDNIFMISAKMGDGVDDMKDYLATRAQPGAWMFPPESTSDLSLEQRIVEVFREKLLELYEHEIPWQIKQVTVLCEVRAGNTLRLHQKLYCRKKSQKKCVLEKLETLKQEVTTELKDTFDFEVDLTIDIGLSQKLGFQTPLPSY